jgi:diadenosine tetraphosphate (Ap4A) HIT family hydrolase
MPVELKHWRVQYCNPPEKHTRLHFLLIPLRHIKDSRELTSEEQLEYWTALNALPQMFSFDYRGILNRDGDATQSSGTIQHFHVHIMVPDGTGRVESPFCKTPEDEAAGVARAVIFEKLRTGNTFEQLPLEEQELVKDRL